MKTQQRSRRLLRSTADATAGSMEIRKRLRCPLRGTAVATAGPIAGAANSILRKSLLLILPCLGTLAGAESEEIIRFSSGPNQVNLIELYTSEGCSSCPIAEAWMNTLEENPNLWKGFVPLAFHVDYWDRLGWKDRFAQRKFTRRQYAYSKIWDSRSVYTPGFAVNGLERRFRNPKSGWTALSQLQGGQLDLTLRDGIALIEFQPGKAIKSPHLNLAVLGMGHATRVQAGENRGRTLRHSFIVLYWDEKPSTNHDGCFKGTFTLPKIEQHEAKSLALAAWISAPQSMTPLQSVGGPLPAGWLAKP